MTLRLALVLAFILPVAATAGRAQGLMARDFTGYDFVSPVKPFTWPVPYVGEPTGGYIKIDDPFTTTALFLPVSSVSPDGCNFPFYERDGKCVLRISFMNSVTCSPIESDPSGTVTMECSFPIPTPKEQ